MYIINSLLSGLYKVIYYQVRIIAKEWELYLWKFKRICSILRMLFHVSAEGIISVESLVAQLAWIGTRVLVQCGNMFALNWSRFERSPANLAQERSFRWVHCLVFWSNSCIVLKSIQILYVGICWFLWNWSLLLKSLIFLKTIREVTCESFMTQIKLINMQNSLGHTRKRPLF